MLEREFQTPIVISTEDDSAIKQERILRPRKIIRITGTIPQRILVRDSNMCAFKTLGLCSRFECDGTQNRVDAHHIISQKLLDDIGERYPGIKTIKNHPRLMVATCRNSHEQIHRIEEVEAAKMFDPNIYARQCSELLAAALNLGRKGINWNPEFDLDLLKIAERNTVDAYKNRKWKRINGTRESILSRNG